MSDRTEPLPPVAGALAFAATLAMVLAFALLPACAVKPVSPAASARSELVAAELAFAQRAGASDTRQAFLDFLAGDATLAGVDALRFREGYEPLPIAAAPPQATGLPGRARVMVAGAGTSAARDLGYSYGEIHAIGGAEHYAFLHLWRAARGEWRLVIDRLSPVT